MLKVKITKKIKTHQATQRVVGEDDPFFFCRITCPEPVEGKGRRIVLFFNKMLYTKDENI